MIPNDLDQGNVFIFGVDLDGVCADFYAGIRPIAAEWLGVPESTLTSKVSYGVPEWGLDKAPGGYADFHKFAVTQRGLFKNLQPIQGCPQVLRRLSKEGVRIRIITHRLYIKYFHKEAISQTIDWLDHHGIPYWDLCFMQHKTHVGANLYVEDSEKHVLEYRKANSEVIIFSNSTNRDLTGMRADNWDEVQKIVLERYQQWLIKHPCEHQKLELVCTSDVTIVAYKCLMCGTTVNTMKNQK
jgi:5'(3')-deoxyribonucleotidase